MLRSKGRCELNEDGWLDLKVWLHNKVPPQQTPGQVVEQRQLAMEMDFDTLCAWRKMKGLQAYDKWTVAAGVLSAATVLKQLEALRASLDATGVSLRVEAGNSRRVARAARQRSESSAAGTFGRAS